MKPKSAPGTGGKIRRALVLAATCLVLSATAATARPAKDAGPGTCPEVLALWVATWAASMPAATGESDAGFLACHGHAGRLVDMVVPPDAPSADVCDSAPSQPAFLS